MPKQQGASYRPGPELESFVYDGQDYFLQLDTINHRRGYSLLVPMKRGATDGLLCEFGLPILHNGVRHSSRVLVYTVL